MSTESVKKPKKQWMRSGADKSTRSAKFRFWLSVICFVAATINFAYVTYCGTTQLVDYVLEGAGILVFAFVGALYYMEKQGKIFKKN